MRPVHSTFLQTFFSIACLSMGVWVPSFAQQGVGPTDRNLDSSEENRIPTPIRQEFKVKLGQSITIELRTLGDSAAQAIRYIIKDQPLAGTLSPLRFIDTARSRMEVDYTPDPNSKVSHDRFSYSAQYPNGRVSAPETINIKIIQPTPELVAPANIDFGKTMMGSDAIVEIEIENKGDSFYEGVFDLDEPFSLVTENPDQSVRIEPGEKETLTFRFKPIHQGLRMHRMPFPASDDGSIRFTGEGYIPFTLSTPELVLTYNPETRSRSGVLSVRANDSPGFPFQVEKSERIFLWSSDPLWLEGSDLIQLAVHLSSADSSEFEGEILVSVGDYQRKVAVRADPSPPFIELIGTPILDFGKVQVGQESRYVVLLRNRGGMDASVHAPITAPFSRAGAPSTSNFVIPANTEIEMELVFQPINPGDFQRTVSLEASGRKILFILEGEGLSVQEWDEYTDMRTGDFGAAGSVSGQFAPAGDPNSVTQGPRATVHSGGAPFSRQGTARAPIRGYSSGRDNFYANLAASQIAEARLPPTADQIKRRESILKELPISVTGKAGEIPLPNYITRDGMLSLSPFKLKTDPRLPKIPRFTVYKSGPTSVSLLFARPKGMHETYGVELRATRYNAKEDRFEAIWLPYKKVKYIEEEKYVIAEVKGLQPQSFFSLRVFTMGPGGTNSFPSEEFGVRTQAREMSLGMQMVIGLGALVVTTFAGMIMYVKQTGLA